MAIILNSPPVPPHQLMAINGNIIAHCNFMIKNNNHIPDLFLSSLIATQLWAEYSQLLLVTVTQKSACYWTQWKCRTHLKRRSYMKHRTTVGISTSYITILNG